MRPAAARRKLNPLLLRRLDESGRIKQSVAFIAGFPNYPMFFETLRADIVSATALTVARLERVANLIDFPRDQIFLDWEPEPRKSPRVNYEARAAQREAQWVARQAAKGRAPWDNPTYCAAWLDAFRSGVRDYDAWARGQEEAEGIALSASDRAGRIRLARVAGRLRRLTADWDPANLVLAALHDDHNTLHAHYTTPPLDALRRLVERAWAEEDLYEVRHLLADGSELPMEVER